MLKGNGILGPSHLPAFWSRLLKQGKEQSLQHWASGRCADNSLSIKHNIHREMDGCLCSLSVFPSTLHALEYSCKMQYSHQHWNITQLQLTIIQRSFRHLCKWCKHENLVGRHVCIRHMKFYTSGYQPVNRCLRYEKKKKISGVSFIHDTIVSPLTL